MINPFFTRNQPVEGEIDASSLAAEMSQRRPRSCGFWVACFWNGLWFPSTLTRRLNREKTRVSFLQIMVLSGHKNVSFFLLLGPSVILFLPVMMTQQNDDLNLENHITETARVPTCGCPRAVFVLDIE